jgi:hypothetical protein
MAKLSRSEQESLAMELSAEGSVEPDDPSFDGLYDQLDADYQAEVDESFRTFANNAVGNDHWDTQ